MKDYSAVINAANTTPNKAMNEFQGDRPPKPFWSAGAGEKTNTKKPLKPGVPIDSLMESGSGNRVGGNCCGM